MKILLQRDLNVEDGCIVELGENNIVTLRNTGVVLGVASNCRTVDVDDLSSDITTHYICDVTISGDCIARLHDTASKSGCDLYATKDGKLTASVSGDIVARLAPRAYPRDDDFVEEHVSVVIKG